MKKISETPYAICGAKTRSGIPCQNWGMANGRCGLHGGKSTGAKTPEGLERIRKANWKHGERSAQGIRQQKEFRELLRLHKKLSKEIDDRGREGSITIDELNPMFEQLTDVESKLFSSLERFQYLSAWDL